APGGDTSEEPQEASSQPPAGSGESGQDAVGEREPRRRRRGSRGRRKGAETPETPSGGEESQSGAPREEAGGTRRRRRRARSAQAAGGDGVTTPKGSTRLEAKRQRRKEGREAGRRRHVITESEYLARRESVKREMLIREQDGLNQIAVLEDDVLVEHYVARHTQVSMVGNVYLGRVQNVLPSMEAAFVDIGKGRNAVLYAGEVNWEAAGLEGKPRRIEQALKSGDVIMVQVTKDPIGHKGARLTAQITLAGRHLVLVPSGAMTGISRKLPDKERQRLKRLLRELIPSEHGVIVRTAAEGASEEQLRADVERLTKTWEDIRAKAKNVKSAPTLLKGEPELAVRVVRDVFNEDFLSLRIQGAGAWKTISGYVRELSPELTERLEHWTGATDIFVKYRVDEQLAKAFDRKVWLPSGGTLIIDRTEAMTVIDVNTGKFTGSGGTLEETVTRNNLEAAEEIVRQLRLRDIGGIIVIDFIDMVLEANRELVLRRLVECLGRDRTRHQVAEVTSLGLVQMTRKRVGQGLVEAFSTVCQTCEGRGFITHAHPVERNESGSGRSSRKAKAEARTEESKRHEVKDALNSIAAAASKHDEDPQTPPAADASDQAKAGAKKASAGKSARGGQSRVRARGRKSSAAEQAGVAGGEPEKPAAEDAPKAGEPSAGAEAPTEGGPNASGAGEGEAAAARGADGAETPDAVATPDGQGGEESPDEPDGKGTPEDARSRKHRVSSSGTITPGASQASAILSFPAK
ncbi:MAG: Rne/Rng family ribonuclease, partial [Peptidiphaga sp.]